MAQDSAQSLRQQRLLPLMGGALEGNMKIKRGNKMPPKFKHKLWCKDIIEKFGISEKLIGKRIERDGDAMVFHDDSFGDYLELLVIVDKQPTRFQLAVLDE